MKFCNRAAYREKTMLSEETCKQDPLLNRPNKNDEFQATNRV